MADLVRQLFLPSRARVLDDAESEKELSVSLQDFYISAPGRVNTEPLSQETRSIEFGPRLCMPVTLSLLFQERICRRY